MNTDSSIKINNDNRYVDVSIVKDFSGNRHHTEYAVFDLKNPMDNIKLMGVEDKDVFALSFATNCKQIYAVAVYLDGVNISQKYGINSLNDIPEFKRDQYDEHEGKFIMYPSGEDKVIYLDRYSQVSGKNRLFTFTTKEKAGVNENLIEDKSLTNRIDVYVWIDEHVDPIAQFRIKPSDNINFHMEFPNKDDIRPPMFKIMPRKEHIDTKNGFDEGGQRLDEDKPEVKIGAGKETNRQYGTTSKKLHNPEFLGKATFIYMHKSKLEHLGRTLIPVGYSEIRYDDPMDLIPES